MITNGIWTVNAKIEMRVQSNEEGKENGVLFFIIVVIFFSLSPNKHAKRNGRV